MINSCRPSSFLQPFYPSILILSLWCFGAYYSIAQTTLTVQDFIKNRVDQLDNLPDRSYSNTNFQADWIDGIDIRTETGEFNFNRQKYLFRVSPSTSKIRQAQTNLHQLYLKKADLQQDLLQRDFIEIAYEEVLVFYEAFHKLKIKEDLLLILQDQERVLSKLSLSTNKTPTDWIDTQRDITELEVAIFKEKAVLETWQAEGLWLNWEDLLPIDSILIAIDQYSNSRFQLQAREYDVDNLIIEREEQLEQAEQKKIVDFVQIEYNGPHDEEFKERVSLTAGFRLPFSSGRKLKMEEIAIEKEVLQQERLVEKKISQYKEKNRKQALQVLIAEWNYAKNKYAQQAQKMLAFTQQTQTLSGNSPLLLLVQKETNAERSLDLLKLEIAIYQAYVDYLAYTEQLYQPRFDQFLSRN